MNKDEKKELFSEDFDALMELAKCSERNALEMDRNGRLRYNPFLDNQECW